MVTAEVFWNTQNKLDERLRMAATFVGKRVQHDGHGWGTVQRLNPTPSAPYDGDRYPLVVKFDSGYEDVYRLAEVKVRSDS